MSGMIWLRFHPVSCTRSALCSPRISPDSIPRLGVHAPPALLERGWRVVPKGRPGVAVTPNYYFLTVFLAAGFLTVFLTVFLAAGFLAAFFVTGFFALFARAIRTSVKC